MPNERITEDFVRDRFKNDPLFKVIKFEEQKTKVSKAKKCLSVASKNQTGREGHPEFIITFPAIPDSIILVECKADIKFHESPNRSIPKDYAVDGALHYAKFLCAEYNVISIAVSGNNPEQLQVSSFYHKKREDTFSQEDSKLLDIYSYIYKFEGEAFAENIERREITKIAIELNEELNDYSIVEYERCTLVSAILLALQDDGFRSSYEKQARTTKLEPRPARVAKAIVDGIKQVLQDNQIDQSRVDAMVSEYEKIRNSGIAKSEKIKKKKDTTEEDNYVLRDITQKMESTILPLMHMGDKGYDVLGKFYTEFIRYAGTDKKTGLVLTPHHITNFFCDLVNLNTHDVVFDSCCGTGGFLIAAMRKMLELAGNDEQRKKRVKEEQLIGIEKRPDMFTYACSNMMMRGDGKSHIYQGDSFSAREKNKIKSFKPTVAFLNPPYDVDADGQLGFIENALSCLQQGGRCVAIVQMSCATASDSDPKASSIIAVRKRLLSNHTLQGVFSMPNELFHPVAVVTCIMVFKAHEPHPETYKTFLGYFKDDGFEKIKNSGRMDTKRLWTDIKTKWLNKFLNRESEVGISVLKSVSANDEWCAEAYMETDYSTLSQKDFEKTIKEYIAFQVKYA